jgi:PKD repeat protein/glucose/arabinose dehydrogenase
MPRATLTVLAFGVIITGLAQANNPPNTPLVTEPAVDGQVVNPSDVHMETAPFSDPDPGDTHVCSDWEIWTLAPFERVWATSCIGGVERVHSHLGDGTFENSHAGFTQLLHDTDYYVRTRHKDSSGDPGTEWSMWGERVFTTGPASQIFPLELEDVHPTPMPRWSDGAGSDIILPAAVTQPSLQLESAVGDLLLRFSGNDGLTNTITNPPGLPEHVDVRVRVSAGSAPSGLVLPESTIELTDAHGDDYTIYLPALSLPAGQTTYYWVSENGSTYVGNDVQTEPEFSELARGAPVPWAVRQAGFKVEVVATGFQLPVNITFVPDAGTQPADPFYYVSELYGTIKVVTRDGTVGDYATGLLDFDPTGNFPGSGEQGLTGIVVDPVSGDVFAAMLYDSPLNPGTHYPKVDRFHSTDGGLTAATRTTILDMAGETQGQSHQISNLTIGPGDGKLYVHMGDGFDASTAQNLDSFRGKVLRLNLDGTADNANPFYDAGDGVTARDYVFAYGFRNPFGGAWRSADGRHYEVENGPSTDRFARVLMGTNYLWDGTNASMANLAIYNWNPAVAPVNIAFTQMSTLAGSQFPAGKMDHAWVSESGPTYATGPVANGKRISEFVLDAGGNLVSGPTPLIEYDGSGKATVAALAAGPDGLYFSDLYKDLDYTSPIDRGANILRVKFVGAAVFTANVTTGPAPLSVQFTDTSNVPLPTEWRWDFGDGVTSLQQHPLHTYTADGIYDVRLSVTGTNGVSVTQRNAFIRVGEFSSIAIIGGSPSLSPSDQNVADYLTAQGFIVDGYDDEPANRPSASQLADGYDLVIVSSTTSSANVAGQFRDEAVPVLYWEQALNRVDREPLAGNGAVIGGATQIVLLNNDHPVTTALQTGALDVFSAPSSVSVAFEPFGPGITILASAVGEPTRMTIMVADAGAELLGGHIAPARRVFLFLEDTSWLVATDATKQILNQAVYWVLGRAIPTPAPDLDHDRDVDVDDWAIFETCASGPGVPHEESDMCQLADFDGDTDVDQADFAVLQRCYRGESILADPDCGE